jgi:hypothetical protein
MKLDGIRGEVVRLTRGSPLVLPLKLPETAENRIDEEIPKQGGAAGGRFTDNTEEAGLMKRW